MILPDLEGKTVLLSASYPEPGINWPAVYSDTLNPGIVAQGVKSLLRAVFMRRGKIVFGGHPTITPFVLDVAESFKGYYKEDEPFVWIYQSQFFEDRYPLATRQLEQQQFACLVQTEKLFLPSEGSGQMLPDLAGSLMKMRSRMVAEQSPVFAVFLGGKDGIVDEFDTVHQLLPTTRLYPIAASGGAAGKLLDEESAYCRIAVLNQIGLDAHLVKTLRTATGLPAICDKIMRDYLGNGNDPS